MWKYAKDSIDITSVGLQKALSTPQQLFATLLSFLKFFRTSVRPFVPSRQENY